MKRIAVVLVGALVGLAMLIAIAPLLLVGALLTLIAAWQRPALVGRVSSSRRLAPVPATVRSTPMRFASSLVAVTVVLTGASMALAKPAPSVGLTDASPSPVARASAATPTPTGSPTARLTVMPTARPTPTAQPTPVFGREPTGPIQIGQVVNVVDGDTIDVVVDGTKVRVRYIGMDTPETHNGLEWLGPEASAANSQLVMGREVVLEKDVSETDQYGRALRYVWLHDGATWTLVNLELIKLGFAAVMRYPPDVKYVDPIFVPAEEAARAAGIGRWGASPTPVATAPPATPVAQTNCEPSYPGICIPIGSPDLDCGDISWRRFVVLWDVPNPDPHRFDGDQDGIGCESG
jgi:micrococcal nuclease